jgi:hypothetical protein
MSGDSGLGMVGMGPEDTTEVLDKPFALGVQHSKPWLCASRFSSQVQHLNEYSMRICGEIILSNQLVYNYLETELEGFDHFS